jgi:hypothetical protein
MLKGCIDYVTPLLQDYKNLSVEDATARLQDHSDPFRRFLLLAELNAAWDGNTADPGPEVMGPGDGGLGDAVYMGIPDANPDLLHAEFFNMTVWEVRASAQPSRMNMEANLSRYGHNIVD